MVDKQALNHSVRPDAYGTGVFIRTVNLRALAQGLESLTVEQGEHIWPGI